MGPLRRTEILQAIVRPDRARLPKTRRDPEGPKVTPGSFAWPEGGKCATEVLPDPRELYEVNYAAGWLTRNQFSWAYEEKFGCALKALTLNSESQVPEATRALAEIPGGIADLVKEARRAAVAPREKKAAESVRLVKIEYRPIEAGAAFP